MSVTTTCLPRYLVTSGDDLLAMVAERHGWAAPQPLDEATDEGDAVLAVTAPQLATLLAECWQMLADCADRVKGGDPNAVSDADLFACLLWATCGCEVNDDLDAVGASQIDPAAMAAAWVRYLPLADDDLDLTDQTRTER